MDVRAEMTTSASPEAVFAQMATLDTYPGWLEIVSRAKDTSSDTGDPGPAWLVDLRAQLGPLRRSKRLRMVRTELDEPNRVRFVRRELDGRSHSLWSLTVDVGEHVDGSSVAVHLHYGGSLWIPLLDRILADEIQRSKPRLAALVEGNGSG
jgi:Polyketide cyclase / dehydrase and lipid transport